jgi:CRISPR/Cas system-associated exonuclease Cas4 (RecB family)
MTALTFREYAREFAKTRRKTWQHDRAKTVGASEVAACIRKVAASKMGIAPDDDHVDSNGFAVRGDVIEGAWSAPLMDFIAAQWGGVSHGTGQENQETIIGKGVPLSATPDCIMTGIRRDALTPYGIPDIGPSQTIVIELKSLDPRVARHKLPKFSHPKQLTVQMGMLRKQGIHNPNYGVVLYVDASNYFDLMAFPVKYDEKDFKALVKRADTIMKCTDHNLLIPEGKVRGGSECNECPYARQCIGFRPFVVGGDDPKAPPSAVVAKIDKLAAKVIELELKEDAAKKARLNAEAALYVGLKDSKRNFVKGSKYVAHAKINAGQNRLNNELLKQRLVDIGVPPEEVEGFLDTCKKPTQGGTSLSVSLAS